MEVVVTAIPVMDKTEWRGKALVPGLAGEEKAFSKYVDICVCLGVCSFVCWFQYKKVVFSGFRASIYCIVTVY